METPEGKGLSLTPSTLEGAYKTMHQAMEPGACVSASCLSCELGLDSGCFEVESGYELAG